MFMKKLLTVALALLLVGCASVPPAEDVSYPVQTQENVQEDVQVSESESETVDAPIVGEAVEEEQKSTESGTVLPDTQDSAENDDLGEPNQVEEDSRERAETDENEAVDAPDSLGFALSREIVDDGICKLRENSSIRNNYPLQLASSFPALTHANALTLNGTINIKVVFIEWANLSGTQSDYDYHVAQLNKFASFYNMVSEGKLRFNFMLEKEWIEVGENYSDSYIPNGMDGGNWQATLFLQEKLDGWLTYVDPVVNFSGSDVVIFPIPRAKPVIQGGVHEFAHAPGSHIKADGETIYTWFTPGTNFMTPGQTPLWTWYAHEFGHALGIPDLRDMSNATKNSIGVIRAEKWEVNPMGDMDIMDNQGGPTITINAWTRWVQGWLDDSQATCVLPENIKDENYYKLNQLNGVGVKDKLLVIKTSATTALLIESRRWDSRFDTPIKHSRNGVVVYRVDSTLGHEEGPLRLYSPRDIAQYIYEENTWPDRRCLDVFLYGGDKITAQGFTIEVERLSDSGDVVKIYKSK